MHVCIYVNINVYMYACMYVHMYIYIYTYVCIYEYKCLYVYTRICTYRYTDIGTNLFIQTSGMNFQAGDAEMHFVYTCFNIYISIYLSIYLFIYLFIYLSFTFL